LTRRGLSEFPVYLIYIVLFSVTAGYPFFWDTIQLASKHATYFYTTNFSSIILPNEIDSGHIPSLGIYLAALWKIFGRSLLVSHLAMLPFVLGIVYQAMKLVRSLTGSRWYPVAGLILLLDPTLLAQCTLVSPDVLVVFFFLMAVNSFMSQKKILFTLSLAGLTLASMRGMMCVAALFVTGVILEMIRSKTENGKLIPPDVTAILRKMIIPYLPSILIAAAFFLWHFYKTGWIAYHANMPWAEFFQRPGLKGALFNVFILGWRLADFGRLFVWLSGTVCLWHYLAKRPLIPASLKLTLSLFCVLLVFFGSTLILHKNLSGHRYLMPVYLMFTISVLIYLFTVADNSLPKKMMAAIMIAGLISGNFWVYPDRVAKGWDSTLAYLPYFPLRQKMMNSMKLQGINVTETGTGFPNEDKFDYIALNGNSNSFAPRDLRTNRYILWSNVYNDFTDDELNLLNKWQKIKELRSVQVKMILFKNPELK
jgi:hypothetical protein